MYYNFDKQEVKEILTEDQIFELLVFQRLLIAACVPKPFKRNAEAAEIGQIPLGHSFHDRIRRLLLEVRNRGKIQIAAR